MVRDLDLRVDLVLSPTVRESDGVALSSRNAYLTPDQRVEARVLNHALRAADRAWREGGQDAAVLRRLIEGEFGLSPGVQPDYIAIVDPDTLSPVPVAVAGTIIAVAARVGSTRLLDNHILGMDFR